VTTDAGTALVLTLDTTVLGALSYRYLPFEVPPGIARIDVSMVPPAPAKAGIGLFDARGCHFSSPGFRGVYGSERYDFFVAADSASDGFLPGPIEPGTWTVLVPVFLAALPTRLTVTVTLTAGPAVPPYRPGPAVGTVLDAPGWYRTDLHCHTPASTDAWATGSAMDPAGWAGACRAIGLDAVALTDHNVVSQNLDLAAAAGDDVLLMAGEEMTDWFHGHATVSGIEPMQWLDWRLSPFGLPLPGRGARVAEFLRRVEEMGAYVAAAHPFRLGLSWQYLAESIVRPDARVGGFEVWSGTWGTDDELSLRAWDRMLRRGWRVWANGGSDLHGVVNPDGLLAGLPTTVVYAEALSKGAVVAALRAGRSFVTHRPDGAEVYLTARTPGGGQAQPVGGTIWADAGDPVVVEARVRRGAGHRLRLLGGSGPLALRWLDGDDETVSVDARMPAGGGYVRAEVRAGSGAWAPMEALTNPVLLRVGNPPPGEPPVRVAPPPPLPGPRRAVPPA
jgi:predicted metal-dependent phosphoesterase TrpH